MRTIDKYKKISARVMRLAFSGTALALFTSTAAYAQRETNKVIRLDEDFFAELRFGLVILGLIIVLVAFIGLMLKIDPKNITIKRFFQDFTGKNAPDPQMHHEYDGIVELDNPIPVWIKAILYGSLVFSVVYIMHYHILGTGALQDEEFQIEMAEAELKYKSVELPDDMIIQITGNSALQGAVTSFNENCATCHRTDLGGDSGPNLTDSYWLHGSDIKEVYATITNGIPGKTMVSWKTMIPSQRRLELASYILSMVGSNPPEPKAPEGSIADEKPAETEPPVMDTLSSDSIGDE